MARIKDVAQRAGVSSATVSRVLNGDRNVAEASRERVLAAARELDYRPNRLARNLRRQTTETIGVVVSDIENPHFTQSVRTIEDEAFRRGFRVLLCNTDETVEKQRAYLETLAAERVRGVILVPADAADPMIGELIDAAIPVVALDRGVDDPRADAVIADNAGAAERATRHLADVGCEAVGFVGGRPEIQTGRDRLAGYIRAAETRRWPPRWVTSDFRVEGGRIATEQLLAEHPEVDGVIVANNLMAVGALKALRRLGRAVGDDIAVVSFDDPAWAEFTEPSLTAMSQPVRFMAEQAIGLLFDRISGTRQQPRTVVTSMELIARDSTRIFAERRGIGPDGRPSRHR